MRARMCVHCYCIRRFCNDNPVRREVGTNKRLKDSIVLGNEGEEGERARGERETDCIVFFYSLVSGLAVKQMFVK